MSTPTLTPILRRLHIDKLSLFALFSVADLFMTFHLVQATGGHVYESNPVASAWLESFGWIGLSIYKGLAILLVIVAALYVSLHRPRVGGRVLIFACVTTAVVVAYSCHLAYASAETTTQDDTTAAETRSALLDREMRRQKTYHAVLSQLSVDLTERRRSLDEAALLLAQTEKAKDPQWLAILQRSYPDHSEAQCLAIHLGYHALVKLHNDVPQMENTASHLEEDFRAAYGKKFHFDVSYLGTCGKPGIPTCPR